MKDCKMGRNTPNFDAQVGILFRKILGVGRGETSREILEKMPENAKKDLHNMDKLCLKW